MSKLKSKQEATQFKKDTQKEEAEKIADKLSKITLRINVKVGENGKVFGGVSAKEISDCLDREYKIKIDKKKIELKETIKVLGTKDVNIKLYEGVVGTLKVETIGG